MLDAWAAGTLEANRFPAACYQDALNEMPADMAGYSTAPDDIETALGLTLAHDRTTGDSASTSIRPLLVASGGLLAAAFAATVAVRRLRR